jgi:hypothetical protein
MKHLLFFFITQKIIDKNNLNFRYESITIYTNTKLEIIESSEVCITAI